MVKVRLWCCGKVKRATWGVRALVPLSAAAEKSQKCCQSCRNAEIAGISRRLTGINWIRTVRVCDLTGILPTGHWVRSRGVALNVLKLSESKRMHLFFILSLVTLSAFIIACTKVDALVLVDSHFSQDDILSMCGGLGKPFKWCYCNIVYHILSWKLSYTELS